MGSLNHDYMYLEYVGYTEPEFGGNFNHEWLHVHVGYAEPVTEGNFNHDYM